jgi:hypothetical protein
MTAHSLDSVWIGLAGPFAGTVLGCFLTFAGFAFTRLTFFADLYGELARRHGFADSITRCKVAINDELADWNVALTTGDEVLFFPPVAGG